MKSMMRCIGELINLHPGVSAPAQSSGHSLSRDVHLPHHTLIFDPS